MRRLEFLIAFAVLALGLCGLWPAGPAFAAGNPLIYATSAGGSEASLYSLDPDTGEATKIGATGFNRLSAIDFDSDGTLWGIGEDDDGASVLITIDLDTGEGTLVGETGIEDADGRGADAVPGCSFDADDTLHAFGEDGDLYTIDTSSGEASLVGSDSVASGESGHALGFDGDGTLYHCMTDVLYTVDPSDGAHTEDDVLIADTDDDEDTVDYVRGMDWWAKDGVFYMIANIYDTSEDTDDHFLATLDTDTYEVTPVGATENLGAIAVLQGEVGVEPEITAGPTATPTKVSLADGTIAFSVTAQDDDGDTLSYAWNFGDGMTGTGASPSHKYTAFGVYTIEVTVSDGLFEVKDTVEATVNTPPTIDTGPAADPAIVSPTVGTVDFSATASDTNGDPITYAWDFGDGNGDTGAVVSHTYSAQGPYTATLTVNDGFDDTVATVDVLVNAPPQIDSGPTASPNPVSLESSTVTCAVTSTDLNGHDLTYTWDFGDGTGGVGSSINHTYGGSGDYTATVTVNDGTDQVQVSVNVRVNTPPTIDTGPDASKTLAEIRETITLSAAASDVNGDNFTYGWDFGDGGGSTGDTVTHDYAADGAYTATLTVNDGLDETTATVEITVAKPVGIAKFKGKLNFKKADRDTFLLKGDIELPADFLPGGKAFQVDVGDAVTDFTLDEKGKGATATGKAKLKFSKKKGLWTYKVKISKTSIAAAWEDEGLVNGDVAPTEVALRTVITVDGVPFIKTAMFTYSAKTGKSGKVK